MGSVYRCRDTETDVVVAIKVIARHFAADPAALESIRNEARAHMRLRGHPNILTVYAFEQHEGSWYLVMDYAGGGTLHARLRTAGRLPEAECRRLGAEVASGLHWAHQKKVLHRDIKPANILLDGAGHAMLADFGIAKVLRDEQESTSTISIAGTPVYMPPEAVLRGPMNARSDLYSLGCMLYEMATGKRPYQGSVDDILRAKALEGILVPDPRVVAPEISEDYAAIVLRATATSPEVRYPDGAALAEALLAHMPAAPPPPDGSEATLTRPREGDEALPAAAPAPAPAAPPRGRRLVPVLAGAGVLLLLGGGALAFFLLGRGGPTVPSAPGGTPAPGPSDPAPGSAPSPSTASAPAPAPPDGKAAAPAGTKGAATAEAPGRTKPGPEVPPAKSPPGEEAKAPPKEEPFKFAVPDLPDPPPLKKGLVLPEGFRVEKDRIACRKDRAEMVYVPEGEFLMGSREGEGDPDEHPQHRVHLRAFLIDRHEVTNGQFLEFCRAKERVAPAQPPPGDERYPVVAVTWDEARDYAAWAGKRLPTEAEWERAARGPEGLRFPWGNEPDPDACNGWGKKDGYLALAPCGSFPRDSSPFGCLDMGGNATEWCADRYGEKWYASPVPDDPRGPETGETRVIRGGNANAEPAMTRAALRKSVPPELRRQDAFIGFRCVRSLP
jgi:hypothetical protein